MKRIGNRGGRPSGFRRTAAMLCFAAAMVPAAPAAAHAVAPRAAAPAPSEVETLSAELAVLLNPTDKMTAYFRSDAFGATLRAGIMADANVARLEQQHPGIVAALLARMQPVLADEMAKVMPELVQQIAAIYAARFTAPELREALAFCRSPAGQRLVSGINDHALGAGTDLGIKSARNDTQITAGQIQAGAIESSVTALAGLSPADRAEAQRFSLTSAGRKLNATMPEVSATVAAWVSAPRPELQGRINQIMLTEAQAFLAREKAQ